MKNNIEELIEHLKSTGTGESKLDTLKKIGPNCGSLEEFLNSMKIHLPTGTFAKVIAFISEKLAGSAVISESPITGHLSVKSFPDVSYKNEASSVVESKEDVTGEVTESKETTTKEEKPKKGK